MKGLGGLMKQAQQMKEDMERVQNDLSDMLVDGSSGAGLVKITMTGKYKVKSICINDSLLGDDVDMLEDLVAAAINDTVAKIESETKSKYANLTNGVNFPGGMEMPF